MTLVHKILVGLALSYKDIPWHLYISGSAYGIVLTSK